MTRHDFTVVSPTTAGSDRSFVTDGRIQMAVRHAESLADRKPWFTASECAGEAVRAVFGRWMLDHTASIRPDRLPLYFQLVNSVENRLGLHRRADHVTSPMQPAAGASPPLVEAAAG
jgi:hypothetical protein